MFCKNLCDKVSKFKIWRCTIYSFFCPLRRGVLCFFCRCIFHGQNCKTKSPFFRLFFGFFSKKPKHVSWKLLQHLRFLSYGDFKTSYGFYRQRATTFSFTDGRLSLTFMEKFAKENRVFSAFFKKAKTCLMEMALAPSFFKLWGF